jgi:hypothetical protein
MKQLCSLLFIVLSLASCQVSAGELKPGFDPEEYLGVLQRCAGQVKHTIFPKTAAPLSFKKVYTSPEMGLHNRWELWVSNDGTTMTVNLRGTVSAMDNGLENIYAAMVPATGTLWLNDTTEFHYKFAADPRALVHAGWTFGACSLLPDIFSHIRETYAKGIKQVIIEGHSQGGALAFLVRSAIHYQQAENNLPADLVIKTYCSAAPKPGNLFFAYDFNAMNRDGWAQTVVSSLDWVPEMPLTVQRYSDINAVNPFTGDKATAKKQNFFVRLYLRHVFNRTNRATRKAQKRFEHYLGKTVHRFLRKFMNGAEKPAFAHSASYMPAGNMVVLVPDDAYYAQFAAVKHHMFMHHFYEHYYFLVKHIYLKEGV